MDRYIGLDAHATSCTFAVVSASGKRLQSVVVETNGRALVEYVRTLPGRLHLCLEEGTQSAWLYEVLSRHVDEIVVTHVSESRGPKNDARDAFDLAEKLRIGAIRTRVFKEVGRFGKLRELARVYATVTTDVVRVQNRLKSLYRSRGVPTPGQEVYGTRMRKKWLARLAPAYRPAAETLYAQLDGLVDVKAMAQEGLVQESRRHRIAKVLETCPGLGPIRVAEIVPVVVTPHRFRTARQFWSYCGLAVVMRSSSDWVRGGDGGWVKNDVQRTRGLNRNHNRTLKRVFKGAATTVITRRGADPLHAHYERLLAAGTKPNLAKLTVARKIAAIVLSMWKHEEVYDPAKHRSQD